MKWNAHWNREDFSATISSMRSQAIRPRSISPTGCPPVNFVTRLPCFTKERSSSRAAMTNCSPIGAANTTLFGTHRRSIIRNKTQIEQFSQLRAALLFRVALAERPNTKAAGSVDRFLSIENHSLGEWFSAYNKKCVSSKTSGLTHFCYTICLWSFCSYCRFLPDLKKAHGFSATGFTQKRHTL